MELRDQHSTSTSTTPRRARAILGLAALPVAAALVLTGCSADGDDDTASAGAGGTATSSSAGRTGTADSGPSTEDLLAAVATAQNAVGSGTVVSVEQERDGAAWEVLVVGDDGTEHEVHTERDGSATAGDPVTERPDADDRAEHERLLAAADLDVRDAVAAVTDRHDGTVTEIGLDDHRGTVVWEADVRDTAGTAHSVRLDAGSGDVVTDQVDTDD